MSVFSPLFTPTIGGGNSHQPDKWCWMSPWGHHVPRRACHGKCPWVQQHRGPNLGGKFFGRQDVGLPIMGSPRRHMVIIPHPTCIHGTGIFTIYHNKKHPYVGKYTIHGMVWVRCLGVLKHRNAIRFRLPFSEGGPGSLLLQKSAMSIPLFTCFYVHLPYPSNHYHGSVDDGMSPNISLLSL